VLGNHTYLTIAPSDPASFTGSANLTKEGALTISGQPVDGYLNSTINTDTPDYNGKVVAPPSGMTDAEFDNEVYNAAGSYPDHTNRYFPVPEVGGGYNSNGFAAEVLNEAGVDGKKIVDSQPGWQPGSGHLPPTGPNYDFFYEARNPDTQEANRAFWASTNMSPFTNWAGGIAGPGIYSPYDRDAPSTGGLTPTPGSVDIGAGVWVMEPGGPEAFSEQKARRIAHGKRPFAPTAGPSGAGRLRSIGQ